MLFILSLIDSVYVRIFNVSRGDFAGEDVKIEMTGFFTDGRSEIMDTIYLKGGSGWVYIPPGPHVIGLTALYQGERFPSQPIIITDTSNEVRIDVYDVSSDRGNITITSHSIGIFKEKGVKHIVEILSIRNDGKDAYRGPLISISLPSKSEGFSVTGNENDYFKSDGSITLTPLILPGQGSFGYDYLVLSDYFKINREGASEYKVFADTSLRVNVKNGVYEGLREFENQKFAVWKTVGKLELEVGTPPILVELKRYGVAFLIIILILIVGLIYYVVRRK